MQTSRWFNLPENEGWLSAAHRLAEFTRSTYLCVHILVSQREHELEYLKKNSRKYLANREINSIPFSASIIVIAGDAPARRPRIAFIVDRRRIRSIVSHDRENTRRMGVGKTTDIWKLQVAVNALRTRRPNSFRTVDERTECEDIAWRSSRARPTAANVMQILTFIFVRPSAIFHVTYRSISCEKCAAKMCTFITTTCKLLTYVNEFYILAHIHTHTHTYTRARESRLTN